MAKSIGLTHVILPMVAVTLVGYFMVVSETFPCSINTVWRCIGQVVNASHNHFVTVVGLVPVFVALMIFGAALLGAVVGHALRAVYVKVKSLTSR